jgi:hypothetical protein
MFLKLPPTTRCGCTSDPPDPVVGLVVTWPIGNVAGLAARTPATVLKYFMSAYLR